MPTTFPKDYIMALEQYKRDVKGPSTTSAANSSEQYTPNVVAYDGRSLAEPNQDSNRAAVGNAMKQQLFKTKFCRHFMKGKCRYGSDCTYAHCYEELTARPNFYKTKICTRPNCSDADCQYAHSIYELHDFYSKVPEKVCPAFLMGACDDRTCPMSHNKIQASEMMLARCFNILSDGNGKTLRPLGIFPPGHPTRSGNEQVATARSASRSSATILSIHGVDAYHSNRFASSEQ